MDEDELRESRGPRGPRPIGALRVPAAGRVQISAQLDDQRGAWSAIVPVGPDGSVEFPVLAGDLGDSTTAWIAERQGEWTQTDDDKWPTRWGPRSTDEYVAERLGIDVPEGGFPWRPYHGTIDSVYSGLASAPQRPEPSAEESHHAVWESE